jgi:Gpi18-like mannosyltransferase
VIALILSGGFVLRLFLATLPGFPVDVGDFQAWSVLLADRGPWNFYDSGFFVDYSPGYLYVLWFIGGLDNIFAFDSGQFEYVLKLPAVFFDLASAYLVYRMLEGQKLLLRLGAPALYLVLPPVLLLGPVWGQTDSILAFFLLLTVYYLSKGRPVAGALAYTVGFLAKPQAVAALPIVAFWILWKHTPQVWLKSVAAALIAGFFIILPFFPDRAYLIVPPFEGLFHQLENAANVENYRVSSFFAYNFWAMKVGLFRPDDTTFWSIPYRIWGFGLFSIASLAIVYVFGRARSPGLMALAVALSALAFYVFLTRMHERYLFPVLLPLLVACAILNYRLLWAAFVGLVVVHFLNLSVVYFSDFYNPDVPTLNLWIEDRVFLLSLLTTLSFPLLLIAGHFLVIRRGAGKPT